MQDGSRDPSCLQQHQTLADLRRRVYGVGPVIRTEWGRRQIDAIVQIRFSQLVPAEADSSRFGDAISRHHNRVADNLCIGIDELPVLTGNRPPGKVFAIARLQSGRVTEAKGNPTLKTLLAVLKAVGMKLSVEPGRHAAA